MIVATANAALNNNASILILHEINKINTCDLISLLVLMQLLPLTLIQSLPFQTSLVPFNLL